MTPETDPPAGCRAGVLGASKVAGGADGTAADVVAELLVNCVKRIRRLVDARLGAHGLTMTRSKVIGVLGFHGPTHQSTLATMFGLAPRTVTEIVDGLERDQLVQRSTDPADRRARFVALTPAGQELLAKTLSFREELMADVFGSLDQSELDLLAGILRQIDQRVQQITGPDNAPESGLPQHL
jgi:DNA-binding MarR family transcriptional regulator